MLKSTIMTILTIIGLTVTVAMAMPPLEPRDKPMLVNFTAKWCGSCKILEPKINQALSDKALADSIEVVVFDLTDDTSRATSAALAGERGLTDLFQKYAPKTGFSVLIDRNNVEQAQLVKTNSVQDIQDKLNALVKGE